MTYLLTREEIRQAVGHLMICGFGGQNLDAETKEIMREVQPLGLILFARNIASSAHVGELNRELKMHRPCDPVLLSVDQEGGRVARLKDKETRWPPMRLVGEAGDPNLAYAVGQALARELRATNFDIDFAPVLDVDTNPDNPIIGDRAFSRKTADVARLGAALTQGLQDHGVGACGKHFPGHGDTDTDSHLDLPKVSHDLDRLRKVEWPPFEAAIQAGLSAIMTAHVVVEALGQEPATLSKVALTTHLRQELKFEGVIVSDDIDMKAVADRYSPRDIGVQGLKAGCDVFLACKDPAAMLALYRGLVQAVESEDISHGALLIAAKRARAWRAKYYQPPVDSSAHAHWLGARAHQELAERLRQGRVA